MSGCSFFHVRTRRSDYLTIPCPQFRLYIDSDGYIRCGLWPRELTMSRIVHVMQHNRTIVFVLCFSITLAVLVSAALGADQTAPAAVTSQTAKVYAASPAAEDSVSDKPLGILCSTFPMALFTRNIVDSADQVTVELLIGAQVGCPHDYAVTPADVRKVARADILVINGLGMEDRFCHPACWPAAAPTPGAHHRQFRRPGCFMGPTRCTVRIRPSRPSRNPPRRWRSSFPRRPRSRQ